MPSAEAVAGVRGDRAAEGRSDEGRLWRTIQVQYVDCVGRGAEDEGMLREIVEALGVPVPAVRETGMTVGVSAAAAVRPSFAQSPDPGPDAALVRFRLGERS